MKYIFSVLFIFISGCSHSLFKNKEYDVRNIVLEKPLVIPSNVYNFKYDNNSIDNVESTNSIILNLIFNEKLSSDHIPSGKNILTQEDVRFLKLLNAENGYPNIRNEVNQESLSITNKDSKFINKILNRQIDEALTDSCTEYKSLNNR